MEVCLVQCGETDPQQCALMRQAIIMDFLFFLITAVKDKSALDLLCKRYWLISEIQGQLNTVHGALEWNNISRNAHFYCLPEIYRTVCCCGFSNLIEAEVGMVD